MIEPLVPRRFRRLALPFLLLLLGGPIVAIDLPAAAATPSERADSVSYVLMAEGSGSSTMSGSIDDLRRAQSLRRGREALLYVRYGGGAYVIRDAATLRQAEAIFAPQQALGRQQAELGSRQAALGTQQARLGAQQARLGAEQARLGSKQAGASPRRAEQLGRQQDALGQQQDALGRQQDELGRQQDALGRQQDALGREQDRLGREAETRIRALVAEAVQRGVAQRVDR